MRKLGIILGIGLSLSLIGCSSDVDLVKKDDLKKTADQMTDILLDNTSFPDNESKEQLKSVINNVTDETIETADDISKELTSDANEKSADVEGQIEKVLDSEISSLSDKTLEEKILSEAVDKGLAIESGEDGGVLMYIITDEENHSVITITKTE